MCCLVAFCGGFCFSATSHGADELMSRAERVLVLESCGVRPKKPSGSLQRWADEVC